MHKITIPQPCHEKWSKMTPQDNGAFCGQCSKVVVDFTNMSDEEVQNYFIQHAHEKLCGRFRSEQLENIKIEIPSYLIYSQPSFLKKFMLITLVVFGTTLYSCTNNEGKNIIAAAYIINTSKDTLPNETYITGIVMAPIDTTNKTCKPPEETIGKVSVNNVDTVSATDITKTDEEIMLGEVEINFSVVDTVKEKK